jgi:hypothetical protein
MKAPPLANSYGCLSPEERFRLILAASGRGDEAEGARLAHSGGRITLSMQDHAPYAHAFNDLALLTFIELVDEAARYQAALTFAHDARDNLGADEAEEEESDEAAEETAAPADEGPLQEDASQEPACFRTLDLALAAGYVLRTKANGWKLFCERLNVPPFLIWEIHPGFDRLQLVLAMTEKAAFVPQGFLVWLNRIRPKGEQELTAVPLTVERVAAANEEAFRHRVEWWGG